jgi:putative transcriptional regulator
MTEENYTDAQAPAESAAFGSDISFANQFLIAMPRTVGGCLAGTVIYVCEYTPRGALGLVINRPTDLTLGMLFDRIDLQLEIGPVRDSMVFFGGPVQTECGFVLHALAGDYNSTIKLGELALTTSRDVLQAVAKGKGPARLLVYLGVLRLGSRAVGSQNDSECLVKRCSRFDYYF